MSQSELDDILYFAIKLLIVIFLSLIIYRLAV